jgi:hypothetical protein
MGVAVATGAGAASAFSEGSDVPALALMYAAWPRIWPSFNSDGR